MGSVKMVNCHYQQNNDKTTAFQTAIKNRSVVMIKSKKDNIKWINKKHNLYRLLSRNIDYLFPPHKRISGENISPQIYSRFF